HTLAAIRVEVRRIQPRAERAIERRPFLVDARVPCRVAIASLVDARLAEHAFVRESEALRRGARRGVQRVALPLVAAIPELDRANRRRTDPTRDGRRPAARRGTSVPPSVRTADAEEASNPEPEIPEAGSTCPTDLSSPTAAARSARAPGSAARSSRTSRVFRA